MTFFSREGLRPRVLFAWSGFSPLPGVDAIGVGGFFCRKNMSVLKDRLKNTRLFALWLVLGALWESSFHAYLRRSSFCGDVRRHACGTVFMHSYVVLALWDMPLEMLVKAILCIFASF